MCFRRGNDMKICVFFTVLSVVVSTAVAGTEVSREQKRNEMEVKIFAEAVQKLRVAKTVGRFLDGLAPSVKPAEIKELKALVKNELSLPLQVEELNERRVLLDVGGNQVTFEFLRTENVKTTVYRINNYEFLYKVGTPLSEVASKIKSLLPQAQSVGWWKLVLGPMAYAQNQEMWAGRTAIGAALVALIGNRMMAVGEQTITQGCPDIEARIASCEAEKNQNPRPLIQDMRSKLAAFAEFARRPGVQAICSTTSREESLRRFKICIHELRLNVYQMPISQLDTSIRGPFIDAEVHARQATEGATVQRNRALRAGQVAD